MVYIGQAYLSPTLGIALGFLLFVVAIYLIFAQQKRRGATLVLVTHDPGLAARCGRRVASRRARPARFGSNTPARVRCPPRNSSSPGAW